MSGASFPLLDQGVLIFGPLAGSSPSPSSSLPLTSYSSYDATSHSVGDKGSVVEGGDMLRERLDKLTGEVSYT